MVEKFDCLLTGQSVLKAGGGSQEFAAARLNILFAAA
jgi:hypothetical protein